jgi:hypothetical protein
MKHVLADLHKRRIGNTLDLRKGVSMASVLDEIETATQQFWRDMDAESEARCKDIEIVGRTLKVTFNRYESKGAPRKTAVRAYVTSLVTIYETATGKRIGRNVDAYARGHSEKPHPFLLACLRAAGIARYPRGIIRDVLEELHDRPLLIKEN